ncbi:hypothetical protein [Undibacterium aquatile]|uniref:Uncharacterized protein n=1 Tax=Undibacterium aquatile TaxID=1537398 RepID=A0ABR6XAC5_9BURK|nr:hypothetical protein [Undibacterium aquatile]MBC3809874.1 hypothetical protein [Undibacterium aquatile]
MKYTPWIITAIAVTSLVGLVVFYQGKITEKEAEISKLNAQMLDLASTADRKIQDIQRQYKTLEVLTNERQQKFNSLAAEADAKIHEANLREAEVKVSFRRALLFSGFVAVIANTSGQAQSFNIEINRPSSGKSKVLEVVINPNSTKEIGEHEGWAFVSGDRITIKQAEHKALTFTQQ